MEKMSGLGNNAHGQNHLLCPSHHIGQGHHFVVLTMDEQSAVVQRSVNGWHFKARDRQPDLHNTGNFPRCLQPLQSLCRDHGAKRKSS